MDLSGDGSSCGANHSDLLCGGVSILDRTLTKGSDDSGVQESFKTDSKTSLTDTNNEKGEPSTPKHHPMAFTIDFGPGKAVDKSRLEELAKKSQARHQRVQSMSATLTRPSLTAQKPPMSAKLPRKAQGYNSEGYFSSDQEDSCLSGSLKLRQSPLAQTFDKMHSPLNSRSVKSPIIDNYLPQRASKSPIVDSIMSRSDIVVSRQALNLPLKSPNSSYIRDVHRTPSYGNLSSSYQPRSMMTIVDQSPEGAMLAEISSPELDILTPDNGLSTPEPRSPSIRGRRAVSEMPDLVYNKNMLCEPLYIDDDVDKQSDNSSTGTYTIEGDNYTEEQKARMSIDRTFGSKKVDTSDSIHKKRAPSNEKDPELVFDFPIQTKQEIAPHLERYPKVSKDKNVLEISCCYESPTENDLAAQTSKQIKSTRSYLEKIKNRVRNITEKTFAKSPPKHQDHDAGSFTSVTTSGVLSTKNPPKSMYSRRRCSLSKSEIDQTDYVHRLSRESSVPVNLPSKLPFEDTKFESSALRNAQKSLRDDNGVVSDITPEQVVGKLSYLSLNRCKGDKTWIQDWADSVKKYNSNGLINDADKTFIVDDERPPMSPRRETQQKCPSRNSYSSGGTPTKIPSPVGTLQMHRRTPDLIPSTQDTEAYLQKTQNAITNLQTKLTARTSSNNMPPLLTTSLISEKNIASKLPVSQLSRSNSLNYRLRRKADSNDSSPLRNPGNYVITGSAKVPESTRTLLNSASKSLDTERRDVNMNSPSPDHGFSNSSDDKTLSNHPYKTLIRHKSYDKTFNNNEPISLKAVLKNNAESYPRIDQTRLNKRHTRMLSDPQSIKRSSSFSTVTKNNNYLNREQEYDYDYASDDSDEKRYKGRIDSPDLKSLVPSNSPRLSNTPELSRRFGPGLVRNSVRVTSKERGLNRMSEPPVSKEERKPVIHLSRRCSDTSKQNVFSRLTKSRSSTREFQPKNQEKLDKGMKKPAQHRSSSALASKEVEFSNWKKRSSYDPMKAAQEGKKRQQMLASNKRHENNKDDLSSPSHSSSVHRSQSFHTTNLVDLTNLDYSSEGTEDDAMLTLPMDHPMISSTHSDNMEMRRTERDLRRQAMANDVVLAREYVPGFQAPKDKPKRRDIDKRKTFLLDDTRDNEYKESIDKRKTFILDSDNSTTNGSSPRNSSIFSHEKHSLTTCTTDTEGDSGPESAPVVMRNAKRNVPAKQRHSGDYSMSSSTTSISQPKKPIQPRYMDISKYKTESASKNFLRRDPSKTYVGVLSTSDKPSKGSAQHLEMEQKKLELEKWKRRASYDPRKSAALAKTNKTPPKTASNVLRSQSFHGPMMTSSPRYQPAPQINETYDASSDNDF